MYPDQYDVIWNSPSADSSGSMPLGNGDIGINAWVEPTGEILFYLSKTDGWSEVGRLLKLGRIRISLSPNPFTDPAHFSQQLHLRQGEIEIRGGAEGKDYIRIWVDANHPVVCVEARLSRPAKMQVTLEDWRTETHTITGQELHSAFGLFDAPFPVVEGPDTIVADPDHIIWYHRNTTSLMPQTLKHQGLESLLATVPDPLMNLTFGGLIAGAGLVKQNATEAATPKSKKRHFLQIHILSAQTENAAEWQDKLFTQARQVATIPLTALRHAHRQWWQAFWQRSWIRITGDADAEKISQVYALQRFVNACAGRGSAPIKFNGSIFTVDARPPEEGPLNADYRRWGGPYWFQNSRLLYWPMLASGDFDTMQPFFAMYQHMLPLCEDRTRIYFKHAGAYFPETLYFWGAYTNSCYGWDRTGKPASAVDNIYIRWSWQAGLELVAMMQDYYEYTDDQAFLEKTLLPVAAAVLTYFDQHFGRDAQGKLQITPAQALETWQNVVNDTPDVAGLQYVLTRLLSLHSASIGTAQRKKWQALLAAVPELPVETTAEGERLRAAEKIMDRKMNVENPELYAIFPYRLCALGTDKLALGLHTFNAREERANFGWTQNPIQAAYLGLAYEAKQMEIERFNAKHPGSRFPAFFGPNYDWIPDQNHGGVALQALQSMLLQNAGDQLLVLPAWPKKWDVDFKLHAPGHTTVTGRYRRGKLEKLIVTPEKRKKDAVVMEAQ
jgi:alpha-L-fucosidase 2